MTQITATQIKQAYDQSKQALAKQGIKWPNSPTQVSLEVQDYTEATFTAHSGWVQTADEVITIEDETEITLADIQTAELKGKQGSLHIRPHQTKLYLLKEDTNGEYLAFKQSHMRADNEHHKINYQVLYTNKNTLAPQYSIFDGFTQGDK